VEEITVSVQSNAWVCDSSIAEIKDSNPAERTNLCIMCSFRVRPLRRAVHLPNSDRWCSPLRSLSPATQKTINCVSFSSTALQAWRSLFDSRWCNWNLYGLNPFRCTMALGSTQLLTDKSTRHISCGAKNGRCVGLTTLPHSCADCLEILEATTSLSLKGMSKPVMLWVNLYLYVYHMLHIKSVSTDTVTNSSSPSSLKVYGKMVHFRYRYNSDQYKV